MAAIINLTPLQPVKVTVTGASTVKQNLWEAVDVSSCDILDLELVVVALTTITNVTVKLITGMQMQTEDGWIATSTNFSIDRTVANTPELKTFDKGFLRYICWEATLSGAGDATFYIRGMGRRYGG